MVCLMKIASGLSVKELIMRLRTKDTGQAHAIPDLDRFGGLMTGGPFLWRDILPRKRNGYPLSIYRIRS